MTHTEFSKASFALLESRSGVNRSIWFKYFHGKQTIKLSTIEAAAKKLGFDVWVLVMLMMERAEATQAKRAEKLLSASSS